MPAEKIEIWGGRDEKNLKLLSKLRPGQPDKYIPSHRQGFECKFDTTELRWIKMVITPVQKLPKWHAGKGQKGWFFIDEVVVN